MVVESLRGELARVSVDGASGWVHARDVDALTHGRLDPSAVRLLGAFDSFLLAHATKEHLVEAKHFKRVYRPQGWISPVVLRGGAIVGVWFPETVGKDVTLDVQLFGRGDAALRQAIEREADAMSAFLAAPCRARFTTGIDGL